MNMHFYMYMYIKPPYLLLFYGNECVGNFKREKPKEFGNS